METTTEHLQKRLRMSLLKRQINTARWELANGRTIEGNAMREDEKESLLQDIERMENRLRDEG